MPHVMQTFPVGCRASGRSSLGSPFTCIDDIVFGVVVIVEARRLNGGAGAEFDILAAAVIRFAFLAQPVKVKSACLKFWT